MPFTAAHPALMLPLLRWRTALPSALVVGSITPDFEYFLRMQVKGMHGHTLAGLLYFNLPMGMLLLLAFHQVAKRPLIDHLPGWVQGRLLPLRHFDFLPYLRQRYLAVLRCLLLGSVSHLLWDSFTHNNGYFVNEFRAYYSAVSVPLGNVNYPLFYALQYISSVVGMAILVCYFFRQPMHGHPTPRPMTYWLVVSLITLTIFHARLWALPLKTDFSNQVVSFIAAGLWALVVSGLIFRTITRADG